MSDKDIEFRIILSIATLKGAGRTPREIIAFLLKDGFTKTEIDAVLESLASQQQELRP